jgi:hypothetical protein
MKILLRDARNAKWQKMDPRGFDNEAQLEELLEKSPDLLPADDSKPILYFKRQVILGQNAVDLVGVDADGDITLVECKLESNREARRMVVAQILEYAAQLWGMDFEEFDRLMRSDSDLPLIGTVRQSATTDWSEDSFRSGVERALDRGSFRLVIAINGLTSELKRILEYVNGRGGVHLEALELRQFSDGSSEVLVPEIYGLDISQPARNALQAPRGPRRSLEEVYANAETQQAGARLKQFVEGWTAAGGAYEAVPGTSGISFRVDGQPIFWAFTPNFLSFNKGTLASKGIPQPIIEIFFQALRTIFPAKAAKITGQAEPRLLFKDMTENDVQSVLNATLDMVNGWHRLGIA